jgi:hypothetical protein
MAAATAIKAVRFSSLPTLAMWDIVFANGEAESGFPKSLWTE